MRNIQRNLLRRIRWNFASVLVIVLLFTSACNPKKSSVSDFPNMDYAKGFSIKVEDGYTRLKVLNPWENAENIGYEYFLIPKKAVVPDSLKDKNIIRTPISKMVCLSTTHVGFLDKLGETNSILGVSGARYIYSDALQKRISNGDLFDVGYDQNLNFELLLEKQPDLIMAYGIGGETAAFVNKLNDLGLSVILNAEYLESSALGKAEWIKFVGALYDKERFADSIFNDIKTKYLHLKNEAKKADNKPVVMTSLPFKENWWVPGGNSYFANLIRDAGGEYIWNDNEKNESFVVAIENMLIQSVKADYWINVGNIMTGKELVNVDPRYKNFRPYQKRLIFNSNKCMGVHGGNDFWESGVVNPHWVLRDMIKMFHPELELADTSEFKYYRRIDFE